MKKKIVDYLLKSSSASSVRQLIEEVCQINDDETFIFDLEGKSIEYISTNQDASIIGGEAASAIVYTLNVLEDLQKNGCIIIYQLNKKEQIILGNGKNKSGNLYRITNDFILKYVDKEIYIIEDELQNYKDRGYLGFNDYQNQQSLKFVKKTLKVSIINMWVAIAATIVSIITLIIGCK